MLPRPTVVSLSSAVSRYIGNRRSQLIDLIEGVGERTVKETICTTK